MKKLYSALVVIFLFLAGVSAVLPVTVADLSAQAQAVAEAEIISVAASSQPTPAGTFPFLLYRARTLRSIAGSAPDEFLVRVPGRMVGGKIVTLPDGPPLAVGLRFVLFLKPAAGAPGVFEIVGFSEGALPVVDGASGPLVITPAITGSGRRPRVRLADFGATVKAARANRGVKP